MVLLKASRDPEEIELESFRASPIAVHHEPHRALGTSVAFARVRLTARVSRREQASATSYRLLSQSFVSDLRR
jgi:hypothetical protein